MTLGRGTVRILALRLCVRAFRVDRRLRLAAPLLASLMLAGYGCSPSRGTIGAVLTQSSERRLVLREVPPGLAAAQAGLQAGDEVLFIDGRDVRELDPAAVHRTLSGDVGEPVKLTLLRGQQVIRTTLRRTEAPRLAPKSLPAALPSAGSTTHQ